MKVQMTRIQSFYKLKMSPPPHTHTDSIFWKPNVFKRRHSYFLQTQTKNKSSFSKNVLFFQKMGVGPPDPRNHKKKFCVPFAFVKNGTGVFWDIYIMILTVF